MLPPDCCAFTYSVLKPERLDWIADHAGISKSEASFSKAFTITSSDSFLSADFLCDSRQSR